MYNWDKHPKSRKPKIQQNKRYEYQIAIIKYNNGTK